MKYTLIIHDFTHQAKEQIARLGCFLSKHNFKTADGSALIFHSYLKENTGGLDNLTGILPVSCIKYVYVEKYVPEICLEYLVENSEESSLFFFVGDTYGNELCTRLGVRLKGCSLTEIVSLRKQGESFLAEKKIYAGHMLGTFKLSALPCLVSIDQHYSDDFTADFTGTKEVSYDIADSSEEYDIQQKTVVREISFADAACIMVLGRGLANRKQVKAVVEKAQEINLPVTGTRPCIMNAWLPMERMVGASGEILKNSLVILLGVSGAPAFYTGVEDCTHIVSINSDVKAPIMHKSDLAICGDCTEIFIRFAKLLKEE